MRIRRTAAVAASMLAFVPWTPAAHAAGPSVQAQFTISYNQMVGGGWLAIVGCKGVAVTSTNTQVPLAAQVTCRVQDSANTTSRSAVAPGPAATTEVSVLAPLGPVYACVSAEAALMETESGNNELFYVSAAPPCIRLPNT